MSEQFDPQDMNSQENGAEQSLEDLAASLSQALDEDSDNRELDSENSDQVVGGQVHMQESAARTVRASAVHMQESAAAVIHSDIVDLRDSGAGIVIARQAQLDDASAIVAVGNRIEAGELSAGLLLAGRVNGNVNTVLTGRTAFALGAGLGLTLLLARRLLARLFGRSSAGPT